MARASRIHRRVSSQRTLMARVLLANATVRAVQRAFSVGLHVAAFAAVLRGLAAFDAGGSAASSYPTASAILFVGGLAVLVMLRRDAARSGDSKSG